MAVRSSYGEEHFIVLLTGTQNSHLSARLDENTRTFELWTFSYISTVVLHRDFNLYELFVRVPMGFGASGFRAK